MILKRPYCWFVGHVEQKGVMHCLMLDFRSKWFSWRYCERCGKILRQTEETVFGTIDKEDMERCEKEKQQ